MSNFGSAFKKARESKGISLDRIAAETRISTRFLLAIENEEFNLLPGGIFNRGFVRTYAEKVGLNPDQALADYERLIAVGEPAEAATPAPTNGKSGRHLYPVAIGVLLLVIIVFYLVNREAPNTAQTASPAVANAPASPAQPVPSIPSTSAPASPNLQLTPPPTTPPQVTSAAPEPEPPPPQTDALRIDIDVVETTWIHVEADGMTVNAGENLEPGTTRHFSARNSILLAIGNAGGLRLKINDMPAKNLGKSGQVRELTITPQNIRNFQ